MKTKIQTIEFNNSKILTIQKDNQIFFGVKSICQNISIDFGGQHKRIANDEVLSQGISITEIPSKSGAQSTLFLPLEYLNGFLFGISVDRLQNKNAKELLIKYKKECYSVLYNHFLGNGKENQAQSHNKPKHLHLSFNSSKILILSIHNSLFFSPNNICKNLGLNSVYQIKKIHKDAILHDKVNKFHSSFENGYQKTIFLPLDLLNYFLDIVNLPRNYDNNTLILYEKYREDCYNFITKALSGIPLQRNQNLEVSNHNITKVDFRKRIQAISDEFEQKKNGNNQESLHSMEKKEEVVKALSYLLSINEIQEIFEKYGHNYDYIYHNICTIMNYFSYSLKNGNPKAIIRQGLEVDVAYNFQKGKN